MGPSPFGVDLPSFPGSLGSSMMATSNSLSHPGPGVVVGGEPGDSSMVGGGGGGGVGGLTMEDVLSSGFWESMVVPG